GDCVDLAPAQLEIDAAQRLDCAERLRQAGDRQNVVVGRAGGHGSRIRMGSRQLPRRSLQRGSLAWLGAQLGSRPSMYLFRSKESALSFLMTAKSLSKKGISIGLE